MDSDQKKKKERSRKELQNGCIYPLDEELGCSEEAEQSCCSLLRVSVSAFCERVSA